MKKHKMLINGKLVESASGQAYDVINPATEEPIGSAPQATTADAQAAIDAASVAFRQWRNTDPWERARRLRRVSVLIAERADEIAELITEEIGKPIAESKGEVHATSEVFDWYADEARRIYGTIIPARNGNVRHQVTFEPVGVVAAFTAWNFPILLMARKIAPAVAAGCTIVCRPSEEAPGATLAIAKCCMEAGLPDGVVNVVTGMPQLVTDCVMADERVRKISFTGSVPVGKHLVRQSAETIKRVTMELGGHAPVIVHPDADVQMAARACMQAKFRNAGQVCASPTRFYVHESILDAFLQAARDTVTDMRLGNGLDPEVDMGPLVNPRRLDEVSALVERSLDEGADLICGGKQPETIGSGYFYEPTIIAHAKDDSSLMTEEPFGPIAAVSPFKDFDEVIERANALEFGLCAYTFTQSLELAHKTSSALEAGVVGVNTMIASSAETPFGGTKQSGWGREGSFLGIEEYLNAKYVHLALV